MRSGHRRGHRPRAQADFAAYHGLLACRGAQAQGAVFGNAQYSAFAQRLLLLQQMHGLLVVAVMLLIGCLKRRKAVLIELRQHGGQVVQQAGVNICHSGGGRHGLDRRGLGNGFGQHKIEANANHRHGLRLLAHGFNQNTAQFVGTQHQVVGPFDLRRHAHIVQAAAHRQRHHQRQAAQLRLRQVESPADAQHQALAATAHPFTPLTAASGTLGIGHADMPMCRGSRLPRPQ